MGIDSIGSEWAGEMTGGLTHEIKQVSPVEFNQGHRYLPPHVSSDPGYLNFDLTPYWIEILECFDVRDPTREVAVLKASQVAYSTVLESIVMYAAGHVRYAPIMYSNSTIDMARARIKRNYIPMFQRSGMGHIFQSSDAGNTRKQGITKDELQWIGGGFMVPRGAQTADGMTDISIMFLLLDELDRWPTLPRVDSVQAFKNRTKGFKDERKIFMGASPLLKGSSLIEAQYLRGDQRQYYVHCLKCGEEQVLWFNGKNKKTGHEFGLKWDYLDGGTLDIESVRYRCQFCDREHTESEKVRLITKDNAEWKPTATPAEPNIRSYQVTGMMSRRTPWYDGVTSWLEAFDVKTGKTKDHKKMQTFYNEFLAKTWEIQGGKIKFQYVSAHRRSWYAKGHIPNKQIEQYCPTGVLFLTMTVDVHLHHLNVATWGWTAGDGHGFNPWLVDYYQILDDTESGFETLDAKGWDELQTTIDEGEWTADNGKVYGITIALVDSGYADQAVLDFCDRCDNMGVFPIKGASVSPGSTQIKNITESKTKTGAPFYLINTEYYKDRNGPVMRRNWREEYGMQRPYTLNLPMDTTDDEVRELTREQKVDVELPDGSKGHKWHRPGNAPNELWDLLVYGHASVELLAYLICIQHYKAKQVEWDDFWLYCKEGYFWDEPEAA